MIQPPLVSVLMTAFNREKYIAEAIESVLVSTYTNFELIIVDDCSTDRTVEIAQHYMKIDSRVKIFVNEKNLGDYPNRNKAASYANGKYIKYLDSDDIIYPHGLEVMVNAMEQFPEAAFGTQSFEFQEKLPFPIMIQPFMIYLEHYKIGKILYSGPTGTIINKEKFDKVGGFSGKRYIGDSELWLKLSAIFPIVLFQPSLIWWRMHPEQEIVKERGNKEIQIIRYFLEKEFIQYKQNPLSALFKKEILKFLKWRLSRKIIVLCVKRMNFELAIYLFKHSDLSIIDLTRAIFPFKLDILEN